MWALGRAVAPEMRVAHTHYPTECSGARDEGIHWLSTSEEIVCCQFQKPCFSENKNTKQIIQNTWKPDLNQIWRDDLMHQCLAGMMECILGAVMTYVLMWVGVDDYVCSVSLWLVYVA